MADPKKKTLKAGWTISPHEEREVREFARALAIALKELEEEKDSE